MKLNIGKKEIFVVLASIALTSAGIKASDRLFSQPDDGGLCPEDMVFVTSAQGGFCIDKYEASAGPSCQYPDPANIGQTRDNLIYRDCQPVSEAGRLPWRHISRDQAMAVCARSGKRLPTAKEWYLAALGTPDKESGWNESDCQVNSNWKNQPGPCGSAQDCVSGAGAYDMVGNVWEWIDGTVEDGNFFGEALPEAGYVKMMGDSGLPAETDKSGPVEDYYGDYLWLKQSGSRALARGGYWGNESEAGQYAAYAVAAPNSAETGIGFRCVK